MTPPHESKPRLLSKQDMADILGYTTRTVDRLVAARKIPFVRLPTGIGNGTKIKFDSQEIEKWLADCRTEVVDSDNGSQRHRQVNRALPAQNEALSDDNDSKSLRQIAMELLSRNGR